MTVITNIHGDAVSVAVGCKHYVSNHKFNNLFIQMPLGRSPRLSITRYYWDLDKPVAVDFVRDLRWGEQEIATKKEYFADKDTIYILVKDVWDGEGVEAALASAEYGEDVVSSINNAARPLMGPRRRIEE